MFSLSLKGRVWCGKIPGSDKSHRVYALSCLALVVLC